MSRSLIIIFFHLMENAMPKLDMCALKTFNKANEHCAEELEAFSSCLKEKGGNIRCDGLKKTLEKCAVKNKLGELENM